MPPRWTRRAAPTTQRTRPRPPSGTIEPVDRPPPPTEEPARSTAPALPASLPEVLRLYARFATAAAALAFAAQLPGDQPIGSVHFRHGGPSPDWWVRADLTLEAAREMVSITAGQLYLQSGENLIRDRGWGDASGTGAPLALRDLTTVPVLELVRVAGLHQSPRRPLSEAVLLLPGYLVSDITRRALDLGLQVSYRPVTLTPLFGQENGARTGYELCLCAAPQATVPVSVLTALERNPFVLVCRRVEETLLMRDGLMSPLPDASLATLTGDETWLFADAGYGCARLHPLGPSRDGASLVRRSGGHGLIDLDPGEAWPEPGDTPAEPAAPELTLVHARMSGMPVDAVLLDDDDLSCLPALLAGEPLAEAALLVRGKDRHLLTAPGGLLEQLPVGEPLYCLGPGNLYLPLGYRTQPSLPVAARRELFPTGPDTAIVLVPRAALHYNLETSIPIPVWRLWAGPTPPVEYQLARAAAADLEAIDKEVTRPGPSPGPAHGWLTGRRTRRDEGEEADWRAEAYQAERAGDLPRAAEIHEQHHDFLRAARLYERAAQLS